MKTLLNTLILVLMANLVVAQTYQKTIQQERSLPKFAFSINPIGIGQFGPVIHAEFGLNNRLLLNTHVRITPLGVLSYVARSDKDDELDQLNGMAFGGGLIYFFKENKNKPYIGFLMEFEKLDNLYEEGNQWEWREQENNIAFIVNPGYRFTFGNHMFINTGAYFGAAISSYDWDYTDPNSPWNEISPAGSGTDLVPFLMLDISFGIAF